MVVIMKILFKHLITFVVILTLLFIYPTGIVFAGSASNESGNIIFRVSCSTTSSSHSISDRVNQSYPTGSATVYFVRYGKYSYTNVSGSSNNSYWTAYYSAKSGEIIYQASTTYNGSTVTATT